MEGSHRGRCLSRDTALICYVTAKPEYAQHSRRRLLSSSSSMRSSNSAQLCSSVAISVYCDHSCVNYTLLGPVTQVCLTAASVAVPLLQRNKSIQIHLALAIAPMNSVQSPEKVADSAVRRSLHRSIRSAPAQHLSGCLLSMITGCATSNVPVHDFNVRRPRSVTAQQHHIQLTSLQLTFL